MGILKNAVEKKKYDSRVLERNVERGVVSAQDAEKHLNSLPDDGAHADWVNTEDLLKREVRAAHGGNSGSHAGVGASPINVAGEPGTSEPMGHTSSNVLGTPGTSGDSGMNF